MLQPKLNVTSESEFLDSKSHDNLLQLTVENLSKSTYTDFRRQMNEILDMNVFNLSHEHEAFSIQKHYFPFYAISPCKTITNLSNEMIQRYGKGSTRFNAWKFVTNCGILLLQYGMNGDGRRPLDVLVTYGRGPI